MDEATAAATADTDDDAPDAGGRRVTSDGGMAGAERLRRKEREANTPTKNASDSEFSVASETCTEKQVEKKTKERQKNAKRHHNTPELSEPEPATRKFTMPNSELRLARSARSSGDAGIARGEPNA